MLISFSGAWLQVPRKGPEEATSVYNTLPLPSLPHIGQDPGRCPGQQGESTGGNAAPKPLPVIPSDPGNHLGHVLMG